MKEAEPDPLKEEAEQRSGTLEKKTTFSLHFGRGDGSF